VLRNTQIQVEAVENLLGMEVQKFRSIFIGPTNIFTIRLLEDVVVPDPADQS
jgi:hypothetical protein